MVSAVGPGGTPSISQAAPEQVLAQQMQTQLGDLTQQLTSLSQTPPLANDREFLEKLAQTVKTLNKIVIQTQNMRRA